MYQSRDPQALETCPYNSAHRIIRARMSTHIVKCRKAHQGESSMTVCLFNANHSIPETELQYHLENCSDRYNLDKHVLVSQDADSTRFPIANEEVENEENWDDTNHPSYKPEEYCKKNPILRQVKVESAAIRKNFRSEERQRMQKLKDMGPSNIDGITSTSVEHPLQNKFRSTPLANTTTNISENYTYEDIQRIMKESPPKAIITNPNCKLSFVRSSDDVEIPLESNKPSSNTDETDDAGATGFSSPYESDPVERHDDKDFIVQKSRKKIGRGRGRGVTR